MENKNQKVERRDPESDLPWRAWGSWFSWGSPVGLGIFFVCAAIAFYLVVVAIK
jgi:hypothetical protein